MADFGAGVTRPGPGSAPSGALRAARAAYDAVEREHKARVRAALAALDDDGDRGRYQAAKADSVARLREDMLRIREAQARGSGGYSAADIARGYAEAMADFELAGKEVHPASNPGGTPEPIHCHHSPHMLYTVDSLLSELWLRMRWLRGLIFVCLTVCCRVCSADVRVRGSDDGQ